MKPTSEQTKQIEIRKDEFLNMLLSHPTVDWCVKQGKPVYVDYEIRLGEYAESVALSLPMETPDVEN